MHSEDVVQQKRNILACHEYLMLKNAFRGGAHQGKCVCKSVVWGQFPALTLFDPINIWNSSTKLLFPKYHFRFQLYNHDEEQFEHTEFEMSLHRFQGGAYLVKKDLLL